MHITRVVRKHTTASGVKKEYVSHILRRSHREGGKVRSETLANLTALPDHAIATLRAALAGKSLFTAGEDLKIARSLSHGHVAAVATQAKQLRLGELLGPSGPERDLVLGLILARVVRPGSKLATSTWWADTTLAVDLGIADASTDEVYAAMDWLAERQEAYRDQAGPPPLGGHRYEPGPVSDVRPVLLLDDRQPLPPGSSWLLPGREERSSPD